MKNLTKLQNIKTSIDSKDIKVLERMERELTTSDWQLFIYYRDTLKVANSDKRNIREYLDIDSSPCGHEKDFIESLERFEVKDLTVSTQSSGLMKLLEALTNKGWEIKGMVQLTTVEDWFGEVKITNKPALKLTLNK